MTSLCQPPGNDNLTSQLAEKKSEYARAMKEDREFSYVKKIYLEIKELYSKLYARVKN